MSEIKFYIGTAKDYAEGDAVEEIAFYNEITLARTAAQTAAEAAGMLFGNVYEISHEVDDSEARVADKVIAHAGWSIDV